jgi:hypothetical protein
MHCSEHDRDADKAKSANYSHLDPTISIGLRKHNGHTSLDKIDLSDSAVWLLQNIVSLQLNPPHVWPQQIESIGGQMRQYAILHWQRLQQHRGSLVRRNHSHAARRFYDSRQRMSLAFGQHHGVGHPLSSRCSPRQRFAEIDKMFSTLWLSTSPALVYPNQCSRRTGALSWYASVRSSSQNDK